MTTKRRPKTKTRQPKPAAPSTRHLSAGAVRKVLNTTPSAAMTQEYAQLSSAAQMLGRRGGAAGTGDAKRREVDYAALGRSSWVKLSAAERSRIMKERRAGGAAKAGGKDQR